MQKANDNNKLLWTWRFIDENEDFDYNFKSKEQAQQAADDYYSDHCDEDLDSENVYCSDDIELIKFYFDKNEDPVVLHREMSYVESEYYHGDFKEHSTWHKGNL